MERQISGMGDEVQGMQPDGAIVTKTCPAQVRHRRGIPASSEASGPMATKVTWLLIAVACLSLECFAVTCLAEDKPFRASLLPQWIPQAQFAGYMVAQEKGFYRDAGLDLTLMRGGPESPAIDMLAKGQATFCTQWLSTALRSRSDGVPVVNIAQIVQRSSLMLIAKRASGIKELTDLDGKSIGCWEGDFRIQPIALFRINDLTVRLVPMYETVNLFLKGGVSAVAAMWYNEYHIIRNSGLNKNELTTFFFADMGLNFPEDGLYCLEETLTRHPDMCRGFVDASLKGWVYALDHPEEALNIVMKDVRSVVTGTNRAHQRWMLGRMLDLIFHGGDRSALGKLKQGDFDRVAEVLKDLQLVRQVPSFAEFYREPR
jgi:NitT/TauT family transport system substrate-binding protein